MNMRVVGPAAFYLVLFNLLGLLGVLSWLFVLVFDGSAVFFGLLRLLALRSANRSAKPS
jgi:hypothetical protein